MTNTEFNEKYQSYLGKGFEDQGLSFNIPEATEFLDSIFSDLIQIPNFQFTQIKVKFGTARFYSNISSITLMYLIEGKLNEFLKKINPYA